MDPRLVVSLHTRKLSPSEGMGNTVTLTIDKIIEEIQEDPATGAQVTVVYPEHSSPWIINFSISNTCHSHISDLLLDRVMLDGLISEFLVTDIASLASDLGFGVNGFEIAIGLTIIYPRVSAVSSRFVLQRLVCEGTIDGEELEIETEPCSICLENLSGSNTSSVPTRMPCSHVFHDRCLLEWFRRKNTCPMCRRVLCELRSSASTD